MQQSLKPRISSVIRLLINKEEPADPFKVEINRRALLKDKIYKRGGEDAAKHELTWETFARHFAMKNPPIKTIFMKYISLISSLIDSETIKVSSVARQIFDYVITNNGVAAEKDFGSEKIRMHWIEISELVDKLAQWQYENDVPFLDNNIAPALYPILGSVEFGYDIKFQNEDTLFDAEILHKEIFEKAIDDKNDFIIPTKSKNAKESVSTVNKEEINASWLYMQCQQHLLITQQEDLFTPIRLTENVLNIVKHSKNDVMALQSELFELLGDNGFDLMSQIVNFKNDIFKIHPNSLKLLDEKYFGEGGGGGGRKEPKNKGQKLIGFELRMGEDIEKEKVLRKRESKQNKLSALSGGEFGGDLLAAVGFDSDYLDQERLLGLQKGENFPLNPAVSLNSTFDPFKLLSNGIADTESLTPATLPSGTVRKRFEGYEEVHVPAKTPAVEDKSKLIKISSLEEYAQLAFPGTKVLNRLQSWVFDVAYNTGENLLICAPTGAGKTNVAMLTILHEVGLNFDPFGVLNTANFKVIYVAPMKALAQEVVSKFASRLAPLGINVKELTGDMQLSKKEITETQLIVTTPEKWDVITRKSNDGTLVELVTLIILDEVHLLASDRGNVIESIVARTLRTVEATQSRMRIVGLSATLPNYRDVAQFLRVNPDIGLFYCDESFRPVPLSQQFIGVTDPNKWKAKAKMSDVAYTKVVEVLRRKEQVMVFVHSRKETSSTAKSIHEMAMTENTTALFSNAFHPRRAEFQALVSKSRNQNLVELFDCGMGIHNAGMLRADRTLTESMFECGVISCLFTTSTLAWGVNLPANTVIIKGTEIYDAEKGGFTELSILDVLQIFGRAGRPQYGTKGEGIIITTHDKLPHYLRLLTNQLPIESAFVKALPDHLNAEIVSGTVTRISYAVSWLQYTYLYIRMLKNPMIYGISYEDKAVDPELINKCRALIHEAAKRLDAARMIRYDVKSGNLSTTDLGRVASHYYINSETIEHFNATTHPNMNDSEIFACMSGAKEFENIKVRDEEVSELEQASRKCCPINIKGGVENKAGKTNVLLQAYISGAKPTSFTLVSDMMYIAQNAGRVCRALFEITLKLGWSTLAERLLCICKCVDKQMWWNYHPLRQFPNLNFESVRRLEDRGDFGSLESILDMSAQEIGNLINSNARSGDQILSYAKQIPYLSADVNIQPISRGILRICLTLLVEFNWSDKAHGTGLPFHIWVEDSDSQQIYHAEYFNLTKRMATSGDEIKLDFNIPVHEPLPTQYYVKILSDFWLGGDAVLPVSFKHLFLPDEYPPHTDLLDLSPLPITALKNPGFESLFPYSHFNPIQTQIFHALYHTDFNLLLGAPTGSGKTVAAELAIFRMLNLNKASGVNSKAIYIGPLKALTRERVIDWKKKFEKAPLKFKVTELTGDSAPDTLALANSDVLITTPEKWDGISRNWKDRKYVQNVSLVIIDEIHLLGADRGPILEVIVSRMRYISEKLGKPIRIVGLSTALANSRDLADWLGIDRVGHYNFRPRVRPVPLEVHIAGFPGKHYCPRMATMNRPAYAAIREHSIDKPVIIFVASRRQTRLTALGLISLGAADNARQWVHMPDDDLQVLLENVQDSALAHTLAFGIGIHHAGLAASDRNLVEELFVNNKIQLLVCTSTLAWGVNFPAHLVIVKGTEFYDAKTQRYVDFPITDVLQMMGRAGRPQYNAAGVACILVHEPKKNFYHRFLYQPFPVESSLHNCLHNHIAAEVTAGAIKTKQDAVDFLSWTYFYRRLLVNPSYYNVEDTSEEGILNHVLELIERIFVDLIDENVIDRDDKLETVQPTMLGTISSYYYLNYKSPRLMKDAIESIHSKSSSKKIEEGSLIDISIIPSLLEVICSTPEYEELPVRHNEDQMNATLADLVPWPMKNNDFASPHVKAFLLVQAHLNQLPLPILDYVNDMKSVVDQVLRILNAIIDIACHQGFLKIAVTLMHLAPLIVQATSPKQSSLLQLPHMQTDEKLFNCISSIGNSLRDVITSTVPFNYSSLGSDSKIKQIEDILRAIPIMDLDGVIENTEEGKPLNKAGDEVKMNIKISFATTRYYKGNGDQRKNNKIPSKAYAPKYSKPKPYSWWLVLGDEQENELLAMKRVSFSSELNTSLTFDLPNRKDAVISLCLFSDTLKGIDVVKYIKVNTLKTLD